MGNTCSTSYTSDMTNTLALWFGGILIAMFFFDYFLFDRAILIAFMRKFVEFIELLAFWR